MLAALLLRQLGQVIASLLLPGFSADLIDEGIVAEQSDRILHFGAAMGAAAMVQLVLSVVAVVLGASTAFHICKICVRMFTAKSTSKRSCKSRASA